MPRTRAKMEIPAKGNACGVQVACRGLRDLILKHLAQDGNYIVVDLKPLDKMPARMGRRKL